MTATPAILPIPAVGETFKPFRRFKGCLIPEALLRRLVSRGAAHLFGQLARYAGESGLCFVGQAKLAHDFRVTIRTVQRWLSELVKNKFLRAVRRGLGTRTNSYHFIWHDALDGSQLELPIDASNVAAPLSPQLPPGKPVEIKRITNRLLRRKCRVNAGSFLSEEGQLSFLCTRDNRGTSWLEGEENENATSPPVLSRPRSAPPETPPHAPPKPGIFSTATRPAGLQRVNGLFSKLPSWLKHSMDRTAPNTPENLNPRRIEPADDKNISHEGDG